MANFNWLAFFLDYLVKNISALVTLLRFREEEVKSLKRITLRQEGPPRKDGLYG